MRRGLGLSLVGLLLMVSLLAGCAAHRGERVSKSGFLRDYSQLKPGDEGMAVLIYRKPDADMRKYQNIIIDPVRVLLGPEAQWEVEPGELYNLAREYRAALIREVSPLYPVVDTPSPETMRLRVALTDIKPGSPVRGVLTLLPVGMAIAGATKATTTGEFSDVGKVETEMELIDSVTGERLGAAVDRQVGTKAPFRGEFDDARDAFDFWAKRLARGLAQARAQR